MEKTKRPYPKRINWRWETLVEQVYSCCTEDPETGCLVWQRRCSDNGYGLLDIQGETWYVHRAVLVAATGEVRKASLHSCDNPPCASLAHLRWGTWSENGIEASERGLLPSGENHYTKLSPDLVLRGAENGHAKLSNSDVEEIRRRYRSGGVLQRELGEEFGVNQATISKIIRNVRWAHVP